MDSLWILSLVASWVNKHFPGLETYTDYLVPVVGFTLTAFGLFSKALPEPDYQYPVPDVADLEKQLETTSGMIIRLAKFARRVVVTLNWFLKTVLYRWFYNCITSLSRFVPKFSKKTKAKS